MRQHEMFVPHPELLAVVCGSKKIAKLKHGTKTTRCERVVYLQNGIDRQYLIGTCGLCGKEKAIKNPGPQV